MHDPFFMRSGQALDDLIGVFDRFAFRDGAAGESLPQCGAFEQFGHEVRRIAPVCRSRRPPAHSGGSACPPPAPPARSGAAGPDRGEYCGEQDLDRHVAAQTRIERPPDLTHAAGADERDQLVRAEALAADRRAALPRRVRGPPPPGRPIPESDRRAGARATATRPRGATRRHPRTLRREMPICADASRSSAA